MRLALSTLLLVVGTACSRPPAEVRSKNVDIPAVALRRVCVQRGLGTTGAAGGSLVVLTGPEKGGLGVDTLHGQHVVAVDTAGRSALCEVVPHAMRICTADATRTGDVAITAGLGRTEPVGTLPRGSAAKLLEYVSDAGTAKAIIDVDGRARFLPASEVCHADEYPAHSKATEALMMNTTASAGPRAFRPRSPASIRRIVIHNTECPLDETFHIFGRPEANTSAHVVVDRDGTIYRIVEDQFAAFHAGSSSDGLGNFNATSLGIEVVAYSDPKYGPLEQANFFAEPQKQAVVKLVSFWMKEYGVAIAPEILQNTASAPGYADLEYAHAGVTIHRLTKADRKTDCPKLLFADSPEGDEAFFRWRQETWH